MKTFGRIVGRLIAVAVSYILACISAGLMVAGSYLLQSYLAGPIGISKGRLLAETLYVSGLVAAFVSVYAFAPAMLVIIVAEIFAIRRALYYAICGGLAGLLGYAAFIEYAASEARRGLGPAALLMTGTGIVAGFVYWYIGGRFAGVLDRPAA